MKSIFATVFTLTVAALSVSSSTWGQKVSHVTDRETFDGYQTFPDDKVELKAIIRERDLHGATRLNENLKSARTF